MATGSVFGAWVGLRQGSTFGEVFKAVIEPSTTIFLPRFVGNAFQSLEDNTAYTYLAMTTGRPGNDNRTTEAQRQHTYLNHADETVAIDRPVALDRADLSDKNRAHPRLDDVVPMAPATTLVLGATGQLGQELARQLADRPGTEFLGRGRFDLADPDAVDSIDWRQVGTVVNVGAYAYAYAYAAVDEAETTDGGRAAWTANAENAARLASDVTDTTTAEDCADWRTASLPLNPVLDLTKFEATGFTPRDQCEALTAYLQVQGVSAQTV